MTTAPRHWELPGPAAFVRSLIELVARDGIVAVIAPIHILPGLDAALATAHRLSSMPRCDPRTNVTPLEQLSAAYGVEALSAHGLPANAAAEGRVAIVEPLELTSWPKWETTLRAFAAGCARRRQFGAQMIVVATPEIERDVAGTGVRTMKWQNVVGSRDSMLHALDRLPPALDPLVGRLIVECAIALAGWDLDGVGALVDDSATSFARIFPTASPTPAKKRPLPRWADGTLDMLDGVPLAALATCDEREVERRIWRGQVNVLFGWLESERSEFVDRHRTKLLAAARDSAFQIEAMEWADLARLAAEAFPSRSRQLELAETARTVRNSLAHLAPIGFALFSRLRGLALDDKKKG